MHYRNDNQNINNESSNYPYMNFPSIMYYPQTMPTYIMMEYDNNLYFHQISKVQIHT